MKRKIFTLRGNDTGSGLLLVFLALFLLSLIGLYMALQANTVIQIGANHEAQIQATYAALAGLNHARALIRGLSLDDILKGPDGASLDSPEFLKEARKFEFRNPISNLAALTIRIENPAMGESYDDGLINTGQYEGTAGTTLIPGTGIALSAPGPGGAGSVQISRYFVKITDNNGDPSEIACDPGNDPFKDCDGTVIARAVGAARTFAGESGLVRRLNSVAIFEARLKRLTILDAGPAIVVLGSNPIFSISGTAAVSGGLSPGIGAIDTDIMDGSFPEQLLRAAAGKAPGITGGDLPAPSIQSIMPWVGAATDRMLLLDPEFLWEFIHSEAPGIAESYFEGDQSWVGSSAPYAGVFNTEQAWNAPGQDPRITVVNGDLHLSGGFAGGGLLIVTGRLVCSGPYSFAGLILVLGTGKFEANGSGDGIRGGMIIAALTESNGKALFSEPEIKIAGSSRFAADGNAVKAAVALIPVRQAGFREVAGLDP